jgi:hypothetical protein
MKGSPSRGYLAPASMPEKNPSKEKVSRKR